MVADFLKKKIVPFEGLTFDDVLLLPSYADFKRKEVDLTSYLHPQIKLTLPVISSPMDTVTEEKMAISMALAGGLGIIHRNLTPEVQAKMVANVKQKKLIVGAAVGPGEDLEIRLKYLAKANVDLICVDSGHGHTKFIIDATKYIRRNFPKMIVMSGNIATYDGATALIKAGAHILRVGMGPGSICTTRVITGMGVPQIAAIAGAVQAAKNTKVTVVADGGIRQMGDMAKAFAFGAQAVMLGSLLARYEESPGKTVTIKGKKYHEYRGMGSVGAMKKGGAERYGQSKKTEEKKLIAEGVEGLVEYRGKVEDFLFQIQGSLRSSFYYLGSKNMQDFYRNSKCVKISQASLMESHPHSVVISRPGNNYL